MRADRGADVSALASGWPALALGMALVLFGMSLLRAGLRALAGLRLQSWLAHVTRSPLRGALAGAAATAAVQSSTATIVTAIGFASAGLLEFPQALGIVLGANVGTTLTGWAFALGIRWRAAGLAPLLALGGGWLQLAGRGRWASAGRAVAGLAFALIGIETLGAALTSEAIAAPLRAFPGDTFASRAALIALGIATSAIAQSSAAGVAAAIAALRAGALSLPQAAAVVIGFDVGTTASAVLAALRGSLAARRTSSAHVIFNVLTAAGAFALLPALPWAARGVPPELALVAFHSFFNGAGAALAIPFAGQFARLVERLVPERRRTYTRRLDARLLAAPGAARRAVAATLGELAQAAFAGLSRMLGGAACDAAALEELEDALVATQQFAVRAQGEGEGAHGAQPVVAALHAVDELHRLLDRMRQSARVVPLAEDAQLAARARAFTALLPATEAAQARAEPKLAALARELAKARRVFREQVLAAASRGELAPAAALDRLDAWRWLERCAHHACRIVHHSERAAGVETSEREPPEPA